MRALNMPQNKMIPHLLVRKVPVLNRWMLWKKG